MKSVLENWGLTKTRKCGPDIEMIDTRLYIERNIYMFINRV